VSAPRKVLERSDARWIAAQHESAHAVVGRVLGATVVEVVLEPAPIANGHAHVKWPVLGANGLPSTAARERSVVVYILAGQIAQIIAERGPTVQLGVPSLVAIEAVKLCLRSAPDWGRRDDVFKAAVLVSGLFGEELEAAERYVEEAAVEAERIVRRHWGAIQAVASSVLDRGRVDASELSDIVEGEGRP
jgi:hypothetical protein